MHTGGVGWNGVEGMWPRHTGKGIFCSRRGKKYAAQCFHLISERFDFTIHAVARMPGTRQHRSSPVQWHTSLSNVIQSDLGQTNPHHSVSGKCFSWYLSYATLSAPKMCQKNVYVSKIKDIQHMSRSFRSWLLLLIFTVKTCDVRFGVSATNNIPRMGLFSFVILCRFLLVTHEH